MARETVWKCDGCGEYADPGTLREFLHRAVLETTQNYNRSAQLCPTCQQTHTAADIVKLTHEQV